MAAEEFERGAVRAGSLMPSRIGAAAAATVPVAAAVIVSATVAYCYRLTFDELATVAFHLLSPPVAAPSRACVPVPPLDRAPTLALVIAARREAGAGGWADRHPAGSAPTRSREQISAAAQPHILERAPHRVCRSSCRASRSSGPLDCSSGCTSLGLG